MIRRYQGLVWLETIPQVLGYATPHVRNTLLGKFPPALGPSQGKVQML